LCRETILIHGNLLLGLLCGQLVLVGSDDAVGNDVSHIKNTMKDKKKNYYTVGTFLKSNSKS